MHDIEDEFDFPLITVQITRLKINFNTYLKINYFNSYSSFFECAYMTILTLNFVIFFYIFPVDSNIMIGKSCRNKKRSEIVVKKYIYRSTYRSDGVSNTFVREHNSIFFSHRIPILHQCSRVSFSIFSLNILYLENQTRKLCLNCKYCYALLSYRPVQRLIVMTILESIFSLFQTNCFI